MVDAQSQHGVAGARQEEGGGRGGQEGECVLDDDDAISQVGGLNEDVEADEVSFRCIPTEEDGEAKMIWARFVGVVRRGSSLYYWGELETRLSYPQAIPRRACAGQKVFSSSVGTAKALRTRARTAAFQIRKIGESRTVRDTGG